MSRQNPSHVTMLVTISLFIAACVTGPTPSSVILARPVPPLLDAPVLFQRMMPQDDHPPDRLDLRLMPRRLVVTQRELTMPGGNGNILTPWEFTLSFSTVESVEVRTISYDPNGFMGKDTTADGVVVITEQRGVCKKACVFMFVNENDEPDLATANQFAAIVRSGKASVDPFGRNDGPRAVAVAFGLRAPRPVWHRDIRDQNPDVRSMASDIENTVLQYAKSTLRSDFRQCLTTSLNVSSGSDGGTAAWSYAPISNLKVNQETELNIASVMKSEELKQLGTNSMLVSDIYGLGFTYKPSFDGSPAQVEITFRAFVDFYDLEPMKDGRYFWFDFSQQRTMAELVANPTSTVREDIEIMCAALATRINEEIASYPGANPLANMP